MGEHTGVMRSANMRVRIQNDGSVFSATVVWARSGRFGMSIQETSGHWAVDIQLVFDVQGRVRRFVKEAKDISRGSRIGREPKNSRSNSHPYHSEHR